MLRSANPMLTGVYLADLLTSSTVVSAIAVVIAAARDTDDADTCACSSYLATRLIRYVKFCSAR